MAVTPKQLMATLNNDETTLMTAVEKHIDDCLVRDFDGENPVRVWFGAKDFAKIIRPKILIKIKQLYPDWIVGTEWAKDQRDSGGDLIFTVG